jgi:threonine dehydrogenase-like Zn-dependent dehydrogenase
MPKVVVVGGGFAGCGAAISARKAGADVVLVERLDELLGTGLAGGVMRNNGRFTAAEEAIAMGGGGLMFQVLDAVSPHKNVVGFPGHAHPSFYYRMQAEPLARKAVLELGIDVRFQSRMMDVEMQGDAVTAVRLEDGTRLEADVFVDATGTSGPMGLCSKHGNGCVMCIMRCPTFGGRVSLVAKAGIQESVGRRADGTPGAFTGAFDIHKDSLDPALAKELTEKGVIVVPLPPEEAEHHGSQQLKLKTCQQYALPAFADNLVIVDNGYAKVHTPFVPLDTLRSIPGFERAHINVPLGGSRGNSVRYLAMAPRDNTLRVTGLANVFCAGEKAGLFVGHTEAIITGSLAGHNAVRSAAGLPPLELPDSTVLGDLLAYVNRAMQTEDGMKMRYTCSGSLYFERMKERGTYTTDIDAIQAWVAREGLAGVFSKKVV